MFLSFLRHGRDCRHRQPAEAGEVAALRACVRRQAVIKGCKQRAPPLCMWAAGFENFTPKSHASAKAEKKASEQANNSNGGGGNGEPMPRWCKLAACWHPCVPAPPECSTACLVHCGRCILRARPPPAPMRRQARCSEPACCAGRGGRGDLAPPCQHTPSFHVHMHRPERCSVLCVS